MTIQDWAVTYDELEPYYTLFEKLFGISGKAGNVRGEKRVGGNPFEHDVVSDGQAKASALSSGLGRE